MTEENFTLRSALLIFATTSKYTSFKERSCHDSESDHKKAWKIVQRFYKKSRHLPIQPRKSELANTKLEGFDLDKVLYKRVIRTCTIDKEQPTHQGECFNHPQSPPPLPHHPTPPLGSPLTPPVPSTLPYNSNPPPRM